MSLPAAVRGELFRMLRNRAPLFWAYGFVPTILLVLAVIRLAAAVQSGVPPKATTLAELAAGSLSVAGNPLIHLFYALGAASLFGGEYRLETWRLLVPRSSRGRLMTAKVIVYLLLVAASLAAGLAVTVALRAAGPGALTVEPDAAARIAFAFGASLAEVSSVGLFAGLVAVATRSTVPAILVPFLLSFALFLALEYFAPPLRAGAMLLVPPYAGDAVRLWSASGEFAAGAAGAGLAALAAWAALLAAAILLLFQAQDLAKE